MFLFRPRSILFCQNIWILSCDPVPLRVCAFRNEKSRRHFARAVFLERNMNFPLPGYWIFVFKKYFSQQIYQWSRTFIVVLKTFFVTLKARHLQWVYSKTKSNSENQVFCLNWNAKINDCGLYCILCIAAVPVRGTAAEHHPPFSQQPCLQPQGLHRRLYVRRQRVSQISKM